MTARLGLLLAALAGLTCATSLRGEDPIKREQVEEKTRNLEALQTVEQKAQQLDQLKTEQARLGPIVSMARQYDGRIDALQQKVAGADAALQKAKKEWSEFQFQLSGANSVDPLMQIVSLIRGVSYLQTSNRDRYQALIDALKEAQSAREQVEPESAELKKLLLEQKKLRACPDPDYAGQDLQACEARLAELNQSVPALANETVGARSERVAKINQLKEEISKLNREPAGATRTPQNRRPAAPAEPRIPSIEVKWPDKQRITQGVGPANPEVGAAHLSPCAVYLGIDVNGLDPASAPQLRIDVEGFGTFWAFPQYQPDNHSYASFEVYVPVPEGAFAMTLSVPAVSGCQPVTIRSMRPRSDRAPTQQQMDELVSSIKRLQQELTSARSESEAQSKNYQLARNLAAFAYDLTALSHFAEALHYAVEHNHTEIAKLLYEHGANPYAINCSDYFPVGMAAYRHNEELLELWKDTPVAKK